jgi:site-specific recombinase XerD
MPRTKRYPGSIRRRGTTWQVRLHVAGEYHTFTVHGTRLDAENFATTKADELERDAERAADGRPGPLHFSALLDEYAAQELPGLSAGSQASYGGSLRTFRAFFVGLHGDPRADRVRRRHVKAFISWRRLHSVWKAKDGRLLVKDALATPHTVNRDLRVLKRLFNYAIEMEHVEANPCLRLRPPKADPRTPHILTAEEYDRLVGACAGRDMLHLFALTLGESGVRSLSEALRLRWEDVELSEGFLHVHSRPGHRSKSGKSRYVPMSPRLREAMRDHFARFRLTMYDGQRTQWIFHHTHKRTGRKAGDRITNLRRSFDAAVERAKVPAIRPHDLRHRRVTTWLAEGRPAALVQEALGHASFATTQGYRHLAREHLRALVDEEPAGRNLEKAKA